MRHWKRIWNDERGVGAVEFAIVATATILLMIGGSYLSVMGFAMSSLHTAAEEAARCAALQSTGCRTASEVQTFAQTRFSNVTGRTSAFVMTSEACGVRVTGSSTILFDTGITTVSIPLTTQACYPAQTTLT